MKQRVLGQLYGRICINTAVKSVNMQVMQFYKICTMKIYLSLIINSNTFSCILKKGTQKMMHKISPPEKKRINMYMQLNLNAVAWTGSDKLISYH